MFLKGHRLVIGSVSQPLDLGLPVYVRVAVRTCFGSDSIHKYLPLEFWVVSVRKMHIPKLSFDTFKLFPHL